MNITAMKTTTLTKQPLLCESTLKQSFWRWPLPLAFRWHTPTSKKAHTLALRGIRGGLVAAVRELVSNQRHTAGIIFLLVVAPLSSVFYQLCDASVFSSTWYYGNYYYFLYTLSPYLMLLFASVGIFLLFPVKCKTSYLATVWPAGYAIAKLLHLGLLVHTNEQFHQAAPWFLLLAGVLTAFGFILSTDYLLYRKYHLKHGTMARIMGIIKAPGIDATTKMHLLEDQSLELENFNQRY